MENLQLNTKISEEKVSKEIYRVRTIQENYYEKYLQTQRELCCIVEALTAL